MKRAHQRRAGKGAFDLIEEATHLLRTAPVGTLAAYCVGVLPFVLGLLFFWADMSRSPFAPQHLASSSLGLAGLFFWLKFWQAIFARRIRAQLAGRELPPLNLRGCARILLSQIILQSFSLFVLPLALICVIPFVWVCAFFQNISVLAGTGEGGTSQLFKNSWRQACLWPGQNVILLAIMLGFAGCVFVSWIAVGFTVPELGKMLFGIDTVFSKSPLALLNTTFLAGMVGLTYICVDPIVRTIYALRCFYGESLESGEDLKAELKSFAVLPRPAGGILLLLLSLWFVSPATAAGTNGLAPVLTPAAKPVVSPEDLDRVIGQTVQEPAYTWRMPREAIVQPETGGNIFTRFFDRLGTMFKDCARAIYDWLRDWWHKLFHHRASNPITPKVSGYGWIEALQVLLYGLVAVAVAALVIFLWRVWKGRQPQAELVLSEPIQPLPDITDENVRADQLPEDGWTKLARELLERGEFRLAMRAFYLASLSHLAARNLLSIARFKSNRDYERELRRRAHSLPDLLAVFGDNVLIFEGIWYGMHEVNRDLVNQFATNLERMRAG